MKFKILSALLLIALLAGCGRKKNATTSISLFNGKDLTGWYTWEAIPDSSANVPGMERNEEGHDTQPVGLNTDPLDVFSVVEMDGAPAIRISGQIMGILVTDKEYENYHLHLQFKWGNKNWPPRENGPRDSGVLYNSIGPEGHWGGVWMKSVEYQVNEKEVGDMYAVDTVFVEIPAVKDSTGEYHYQKGAQDVIFSPELQHCAKDVDYEKPVGEWNTIDIYTVNGKSIHVINGKVNNRIDMVKYLKDGVKVPLTKGKIQLQSEGSEVYYRNITLTPIAEIPQNLL